MKRTAFDLTPIPTLVFRESLVVEMNDAAAVFLGRRREDTIGRVTYPDLLAPEERARVTARHEQRLRGENPPPVYETTALAARGPCPVRLHTAIDGHLVVVQVIDLSVDVDRRERLHQVAQLGAAIQLERSEEAILRRVAEGASTLDLTSGFGGPLGSGMQIEFVHGPPEWVELVRSHLGPFVGNGTVLPGGEFYFRAWREGAAFSDDFPAVAEQLFGGVVGAQLRAAMVARGPLLGAAVRIDDADRPMLLTLAGSWLREEDLPAVRLFGSQVSAALGAARAIEHLSRKNAELAAVDRMAQAAGAAPDQRSLLEVGCAAVREAIGCHAVGIWLVDEERGEAYLAHEAGGSEGLRTKLQRVPLASSPLAEVARSGSPRVFCVEELGEPASAVARASGLKTFTSIPLKVRSSVVAVMNVAFRDARRPEDCRVELLQALGGHFAGAIEVQKLLGDLRQRLSELTLLNDLAMASATLDPVLLLENALRRVVATFDASAASGILLRDGRFEEVASVGLSAATREHLTHFAPASSAAARTLEDRSPVVVDRMSEGSERQRYLHAHEGLETMAMVPLLVKDRALGSLAVGRRSPRPFTEPELGLLSAIGVQLGVALDNARLYAEANARVQQLSVLNEVSRALTSSLELDRVLEEGARATVRILECSRCVVLRYDPRTETLTLGASTDGAAEPEYPAIPIAADSLPAMALRERRAIAEERVDTAEHAGREIVARLGIKSSLFVPLVVRDELLGVLIASEQRRYRRFTPSDIGQLTAVASQLAVAIDNARLYEETRRRAEQMLLVNEVGRSLVASLELDQVLDAGVRNLARIVDCPDAYLLLPNAAGTDLVLRAVAGYGRQYLGVTCPAAPPEHNLQARCYVTREVIVVEDADEAPWLNPTYRALTGGHAYLALPLVVRDRSIGCVVIVDPRGPHRWNGADVERAAAIANQLAIAVENARLYDDLKKSYADLAQAQQLLLRQERLAALGELSAVVAHEIRNPLGVIFNSLSSLRRLVRLEGDALTLFEIVGEEADRVNRIIRDLLDFARPKTPALLPEPLGPILQEAVGAATAGDRGGIAVRIEVDPAMPPVPVDSGLMRQALVNLAQNAVQAMPRGGTLTVRAGLVADAVRIEVSDTGPGIPEEMRHRLFEPFFTTKATGTGLGLALVKRIVEAHGGRISVEGTRGAGTTFSLSLPPPPPAPLPPINSLPRRGADPERAER